MTVFVDKLKYKAPLAAGRFDSKQVCQGFHKTKVWWAVFKKKAVLGRKMAKNYTKLKPIIE